MNNNIATPLVGNKLNTPIWARLEGHVPLKVWLELPKVCTDFSITTVNRLAHLLGQAKHESGNFKSVYENLNYSAQGLANTWPTRYAVDPKAKTKVPNDLAKKLERKPEAIANNCYSNRMGNGNEASGEGWLYRGRGYLQTTGKDNYKVFGNHIKIDLVKNPDFVATEYALSSAAFFFLNKKLWSTCDKGIDGATIELVTRSVNGALHGYKERLEYTQEYHKILTAT
jgi:putative chitinase